MAKDPVCGMMVDEKKAAATFEYKGVTYYFCSHHCRMTFMENPDKYAQGQGEEMHEMHRH